MMLRPRDRRALMIGAIAVVAGSGYRYGALPVFQAHARMREALEAERDLLARERGMIAGVPGLTDAVKQHGEFVLKHANRLFVAQRDVNLTAAEMQAFLEEVARGASLNVTKFDVEPRDSLTDGLSAVTLRMRGQGDFEGLLELMRALESGPRLAAVRELIVQQTARPGSAPTPYEVLDYTLLIDAFAVRGRP